MSNTAPVTAAALMEAEHTQPGPEQIWLSRLASPQREQHAEDGEQLQQVQPVGEHDGITHPTAELLEARNRERVEELALLALTSVSNTTATAEKADIETVLDISELDRTDGKVADVSSSSIDNFRARSERLTVGLGDAIARAQERANTPSHLDQTDTDTEEGQEGNSGGGTEDEDASD